MHVYTMNPHKQTNCRLQIIIIIISTLNDSKTTHRAKCRRMKLYVLFFENEKKKGK